MAKVTSLLQLSGAQRSQLRDEADELVRSGVWKVHTDATTKKPYYSNRTTKQTTWDLEKYIATHTHGWLTSKVKEPSRGSGASSPTNASADTLPPTPPSPQNELTSPTAPSSTVSSAASPNESVPSPSKPPPPKTIAPPPPLKTVPPPPKSTSEALAAVATKLVLSPALSRPQPESKPSAPPTSASEPPTKANATAPSPPKLAPPPPPLPKKVVLAETAAPPVAPITPVVSTPVDPPKPARVAAAQPAPPPPQSKPPPPPPPPPAKKAATPAFLAAPTTVKEVVKKFTTPTSESAPSFPIRTQPSTPSAAPSAAAIEVPPAVVEVKPLTSPVMAVEAPKPTPPAAVVTAPPRTPQTTSPLLRPVPVAAANVSKRVEIVQTSRTATPPPPPPLPLPLYTEKQDARQEALQRLFKRDTRQASRQAAPTWMQHESCMPALVTAEPSPVANPVQALPPLALDFVSADDEWAKDTWVHECYFVTGSVPPKRGVARFTRRSVELFAPGWNGASPRRSGTNGKQHPDTSVSVDAEAGMVMKQVLKIEAPPLTTTSKVLQCAVPFTAPSDEYAEASVAHLPTSVAVSCDVDTHMLTVVHLGSPIAALRCIGVGSHIPTIAFVDPSRYPSHHVTVPHADVDLGVVLVVTSQSNVLVQLLTSHLNVLARTSKLSPPRNVERPIMLSPHPQRDPWATVKQLFRSERPPGVSQHSGRWNEDDDDGNEGPAQQAMPMSTHQHQASHLRETPVKTHISSTRRQHSVRPAAHVSSTPQSVAPVTRAWQRHADPALLDDVYQKALKRGLPTKEQLWNTGPQHSRRASPPSASVSKYADQLEKRRRPSSFDAPPPVKALTRDVVELLEHDRPKFEPRLSRGVRELPAAVLTSPAEYLQRVTVGPSPGDPTRPSKAAMIEALLLANRDLDKALAAHGITEW